MITRFEGPGGPERLVAAIRLQQIVSDEESIAVELATAATLVPFEAVAGKNEIIREGGADNEIYLIISGRVKILDNGREVAIRTAGQHIGEMALIDPREKRAATVIALEPTVLARVTEPDFSKLAKKYPQLWRRLALELAQRLRERKKFHTPPNEKPILFVGSSVEGLAVAREIQTCLVHDPIVTTVWTDGVFRASTASVESLLVAVKKSDFAVLLLTPDDTGISRKVENAVPRDNCIFELGLFMGALGRERTFIVKPRGTTMKLPSDLFGLTPMEYTEGPPDTLPSRIAPVCNEIRKIVLQLKSK